jgi:hypothetical protein
VTWLTPKMVSTASIVSAAMVGLRSRAWTTPLRSRSNTDASDTSTS